MFPLFYFLRIELRFREDVAGTCATVAWTDENGKRVFFSKSAVSHARWNQGPFSSRRLRIDYSTSRIAPGQVGKGIRWR